MIKNGIKNNLTRYFNPRGEFGVRENIEFTRNFKTIKGNN